MITAFRTKERGIQISHNPKDRTAQMVMRNPVNLGLLLMVGLSHPRLPSCDTFLMVYLVPFSPLITFQCITIELDEKNE